MEESQKKLNSIIKTQYVTESEVTEYEVAEPQPIITEKKASSYALKRLPLWGYQIDEYEIEFEWPTESEFKKMQHDVTLESMSLKAAEDSVLISSV